MSNRSLERARPLDGKEEGGGGGKVHPIDSLNTQAADFLPPRPGQRALLTPPSLLTRYWPNSACLRCLSQSAESFPRSSIARPALLFHSAHPYLSYFHQPPDQTVRLLPTMAFLLFWRTWMAIPADSQRLLRDCYDAPSSLDDEAVLRMKHNVNVTVSLRALSFIRFVPPPTLTPSRWATR